MSPKTLALRWIGPALVVALLTGCGQPPQIGADPVARKEAEALYTAINSRRENLLAECRERLSRLHQEGRLGASPYEAMIAIADQADAGDWEPAAESLWTFMRKQGKAE